MNDRSGMSRRRRTRGDDNLDRVGVGTVHR